MLPPGISPHVRMPPTLVHLDEVKIREDAAIIPQTKLFNHLRDESISLIIVPTPLAHKTVVNQNLLVGEPSTIGEAPVDNFYVGLSRQHLSPDILIADSQVPACPAIESLSNHLVVILRKLALRVQTNLGAHTGEVEQAAGLLVATFDSFNFHRDVCICNDA